MIINTLDEKAGQIHNVADSVLGSTADITVLKQAGVLKH
jgi:hypothetical protein